MSEEVFEIRKRKSFKGEIQKIYGNHYIQIGQAVLNADEDDPFLTEFLSLNIKETSRMPTTISKYQVHLIL